MKRTRQKQTEAQANRDFEAYHELCNRVRQLYGPRANAISIAHEYHRSSIIVTDNHGLIMSPGNQGDNLDSLCEEVLRQLPLGQWLMTTSEGSGFQDEPQPLTEEDYALPEVTPTTVRLTGRLYTPRHNAPDKGLQAS